VRDEVGVGVGEEAVSIMEAEVGNVRAMVVAFLYWSLKKKSVRVWRYRFEIHVYRVYNWEIMSPLCVL